MHESNNVVSVTKDAYRKVRTLSNCATCILWLSAGIIVFDFFRSNFNWFSNVEESVWGKVDNIQILLIFAYHILATVSSAFHFWASKKKYPDLVDDVYGSHLSHTKSSNYFNSSHLKTPEKKLAWNIAENVFFSKWILKKGMPSMVIKIIIIALIFLTSFFVDHSYWFISILKLTIPIIWLKKSVVYFYAYYQLNGLNDEMRNLLVTKSIAKDLQAQSLKYALTYESLMAWLNTPVSEKIYKKYNAQINEEFKTFSSNFVI